jgi:hypothetical protein
MHKTWESAEAKTDKLRQQKIKSKFHPKKQAETICEETHFWNIVEFKKLEKKNFL